MDRVTIEFSDDEIRRVHEAAVEIGVSDTEFIKSSANDRSLANDRLPLHLRSDDEIGQQIRCENKELYKRLS
jgi:hypothetical protein